MAIDDQRGPLGREHSGGAAPRQDQTRADSDRGYGAREGQRESGRDTDPDRGSHGRVSAPTPDLDRGEVDRQAAARGRADSDDRGVYGKPGAFYEHQDFGVGERAGGYAPQTGETDPRFSGTGRTDEWGGRGDEQSDEKAGWRSVGGANPQGLVGGEDEKPGDGDPLGAGVR